MITWILALLLSASSAAPAGTCTILIHGLARTSRSMNSVQTALEAKGYRVFNVEYPSRDFGVDSLAELAVGSTLRSKAVDSCSTVHFVTHSLGGILVRAYLSKHAVPRSGRVVMLGPPNHGSEVVDHLKDYSLFDAINGPAGSELGTDALSKPNTIGVPELEIGIIAGDRSINWINSILIPGPDDGKVSLQSSKLLGMKDWIVLHTTHPTMLTNDDVIRQTIHFLEVGTFVHPKDQTRAKKSSSALEGSRPSGRAAK